ncbi:MAG: hypothetical protein U0Q15_12755 [Kineosporiaceae bacterium]
MTEEPGHGAVPPRQAGAALDLAARRRRRRRRRGVTRWLAAGTGVAVAAGLAWVAQDGSAWPRQASPGASATSSPSASALAGRTPDLLQDRNAALRQLLLRRGRAVVKADERGWLADVDPDPARSRPEAETFRRLRLLPWSTWRYDVVDTSVPLPPGPAQEWRTSAWAVQVQLSYRLSSDQRDVHRTRTIVLRPLNGRWVIAMDLASGDTRDPWDLGRIAVLKGAHSLLVVPSAGRSKAAAYVADLEAARRQVNAVWRRQWPAVSVVYLPADDKAMASMLGRSSVTGLDQVAAVTTGELLRGTGTADRIVLNPSAFAGFGKAERRVVLAHELTHVATRASVRLAPPMWLEEGFADYVAYRSSGVSRELIADSLIDKVRQGSAPDHLPAAADFDPRAGDIGPAYAGAWLAVDLIARTKGRAALVRFYEQVCGLGAGASTASPTAVVAGQEDERAREALDDQLDLSEQVFVDKWRQSVGALAQEADS